MKFLKQQPKVLPLLIFAEIIQRFNYYGIQSIILLYLIKHISIADKSAYIVYGAFTALTFILSIVGGILADKFFGFYKVVISGIVLTMIGMLFLGMTNINYTVGLSFVIGGVGLFLPNNASLLGSFYSENNSLRQKGFSFFYMGTNIGGLLGPIVFGVIAVYNWDYSFDLGAIFLSIWLLVFYFIKKITFNHSEIINAALSSKKLIALFVVIYAILLASVIYLMNHPQFVGTSLYVIGMLVCAGIIYISKDQSKLDRNRIYILFLMICMALLFFSVTFQIYSSLMLFIDKFVSHQILNWKIPATSFSCLEPFFVIALSPIFVKVWSYLHSKQKEPLLLNKLLIGLFSSGICFLVFAFAAYLATDYSSISAIWIIVGNLFLGAGELCIMPPLIAAIAALSPKFLRGTIMGVLYLSLAFSGYLSGKVAALTVGNNLPLTASSYSILYLKIAFFAFTISGALFFIFKANDHRLRVLLTTDVV